MVLSKKLKQIEVTRDIAEFSYSNVKDLVQEYYDQKKLNHHRLEHFPSKCKYDLKWLVVSCYLQGMADAQQVLTQ